MRRVAAVITHLGGARATIGAGLLLVAAGERVLGIAALVAASRVSLRVHHVADVVAGAALGVAGAIGAAALLLP